MVRRECGSDKGRCVGDNGNCVSDKRMCVTLKIICFKNAFLTSCLSVSVGLVRLARIESPESFISLSINNRRLFEGRIVALSLAKTKGSSRGLSSSFLLSCCMEESYQATMKN